MALLRFLFLVLATAAAESLSESFLTPRSRKPEPPEAEIERAVRQAVADGAFRVPAPSSGFHAVN